VTGPVLAVRGLEAGWDPAPVVHDADLDVDAAEIVAVLGGNGSGKSSLLWAVARLLRAPPGHGCTRRPPGRDHGCRAPNRPGTTHAAAVAAGVPSLTVAENLDVVELASRRPDRAASRARRAEWLERFPVLEAMLDQPAASLSGGEQQLLAIGRVLSTLPRVLLLNEPTAVSPLQVNVPTRCPGSRPRRPTPTPRSGGRLSTSTSESWCPCGLAPLARTQR